ELCSRGTGILGNDLAPDALGLVGIAQALLHISQLEQRIGHLGVLRIVLGNLGESLTSGLKISLDQVDLAQPVLCIACVLAVGVLAQKCAERLIGARKILGLDQIEGGFVIKLFLRRIGWLTATLRGLSGCCVGVDRAI